MKATKDKKKIINKMIISELINFKLYKTKISKYNSTILSNYYILKQISYNLKKILQIIFQYHFYRKKILIIGENLTLTNKKTFYIFKKTDHIFIPKETWVNGLFSNKKKLKEFLKKKNPLLKKIDKPKLIIFYSYWNLLDSERYQRKINEVTLINKTKFDLQKKLNYFLIGGYFNIVEKKIFYNVFSSFLKKIFKIRKAYSFDFFRIPLYYLKKKKFKKRIYRLSNNNKFLKMNNTKIVKNFKSNEFYKKKKKI